MGESAEEGGGLNLGLSIGGCFTGSTGEEEKRGDAGSTGFKGMYCRNKEEAEELLEQRRKKDLHALRRQAARRKRDDKRSKRAKTTGEDVDEESTPGKEEEQKRTPSGAGYPNGGIPFVPMMQYVIQNGNKVQYIPVTVPYVLPCWPASSSPPFPPALLSDASRDSDPVAAQSSGTVYQPVPSRSVGGNHRAGPQSSSASSSSAVSDNKSGGGSRSDSRSHSQSEQCRQVSVSSLAQSGSLDKAEAQSKPHKLPSLPSGAVPASKKTDSVNAGGDKLTVGTTPASAPSNNGMVSANAREENGKPSPVSASASGGQKSVTAPSLPPMPCVSTTGDGPNGKTVTGFLYRYTKSEVSIMCVCHGNSFSPAEFIKHAGGTDTANPLRHIIVVPSPVGGRTNTNPLNAFKSSTTIEFSSKPD